MAGFIKLHRSIMDNWLNKDDRKFSRLEAWIDMLINVNYVDKKTVIKGTVYHVKRGQSIYSLSTWAKRWKWDKSATRRFLQLLEKDGMITMVNETQTTQITICNYERYQDERNASETQVKRKRTENETEMKQLNIEISDTYNGARNGYETQVKRQPTPTKEERSISKDIQDMALIFIEHFNQVYNQKRRVTDQISRAIKVKLNDYTIDEICQAVTKSKTSSAWVADKIVSSPILLLRSRTTNGESVDYISDLLNSPPKQSLRINHELLN